MKSLEYVENRLLSMVRLGKSKPEILREIGKCCEGWPYVFGAWGEPCTPGGRRKRKRDDHPTVVSACPVLSGKRATCAGCKWDLPVRMFDCRGFVNWIFKQIGIGIAGQGCNTQYDTASNWILRGPVSAMPRDKVCCVFTGTEKKKQHVGIYLGDGTTVECSSGVQFSQNLSRKWTFFAIPAGLYGKEEIPVPEKTQKTTVLRRGSAGNDVRALQEKLISLGYACGAAGADGKYGAATEAAVRLFQRERGLASDGIAGEKTFAALEGAAAGDLYSVTIPHLTKTRAESVVQLYEGANMVKEGVSA